MDRNKTCLPSRGQKKVLLGAELFALGTKSSRDESKTKIIPIKGMSATGTASDRKREASANINHPNKRFRGSLKDGYSDITTSTKNFHYEIWEQLSEECDLSNVIESFYSNIDQNENEVIRVICGIIRHATSTAIASRTKVDSTAYLILLYLAKLHPSFFNNNVVSCALLSFLRRETNIKMRFTINLHILFANLLTRGFTDVPQWPESLLRIYIEDAVNERFWTDNDYCSPLVRNICAAFNTRTPHLSLLRWDAAVTSGQTHRENFSVDDDSGDNSAQSVDTSSYISWELDQTTDLICTIKSRFADSIVQKVVSDAIREQLNKRQQQDNYTRNFLKFLCSSSGIAEVRCLCISRLELWIHNGKLVKFAQQLLSYICFNIKAKNSQDNEVLQVLIKMRLKTKPLINHYMSCLKEMLHLQPDILNTVMKLVVQNELSNTRNPNNMGMLATMFQTSPDQSADNLAEIYQEYLLQRDDCLRTLRVFLRELIRMLRFEVNLVKFCKTFLNEREDLKHQIIQFDFKDRIFHSMVDIICLCMLLSVTPQSREGSLSLKTNKDVKNNPALIKLYHQISQIQLDSVSWMYETVPNLFKIQSIEYLQALHKLLLLENAEQYSRCDQWPSEPERGAILKIISETPVHEETLLRIILIGITKDIPFSIANTFDILLLVIKRVSGMKALDFPAVQANKFDIIDFLFSMSEYHHPENIRLPEDYEPPKLAIIAFYWKAWLILLMISAHNPSTFGAFCWDHYPTMKMLIEICITSQYNSYLSNKDELQTIAVERESILQFESYLAAQTSPHAVITEENAILTTQLMLMDPMGTPRKAPNLVLEQLRYLNQTFKLGHLFCRCRKPDLLLDIIQRQGTTQSMPWLSDLVQNSEGDFGHLPVQCLCEFLLFNAHIINEENSRDAELVNFIRNLIMKSSFNNNTVCEVLDYIFRRLSSTVKQSRKAALSGLKIIFKNSSKYENDWLLKSIQRIPHFFEAKVYIIPQLRAACQVENCPELIMAYIQFITTHTLNDPVNEMLDHVIDMAQLIVERNTMFQQIIISQKDFDMNPDENRIQTLKCLFVMFNNYIIKLREFHEPYEWTEYPDLLMVQFEDGVQLPLHINIIHAFIILLTYSNNKITESVPILDYWFPLGRPAPVAYLPTIPQEQIQLLPDWLKLKMIRSSVDRLIDAALRDLTPDQIVLFVQNFGTPVNSMSKLLAMLDTAVLEQFDLVKNAILNKAYLAQLIEIQQVRGAKNGHYIVQALDLHSHSQTVPDFPVISSKIKETLSTNGNTDFSSNSNKNISLNDIVKITSPDHELLVFKDFRKLIHILLDFVAGSKATGNDFLTSLCELVSDNFLMYSCAENYKKWISVNQRISTLFRALFFSELPNNLYKLIESKLKKNIEMSKSFSITKPLCRINIFQNSLLYMLNTSFKLHFQNLEVQNTITINREVVNETIDAFKFENVDVECTEIENYYRIFKNGLFIDWLSETDPEVIQTKILKKSILFTKPFNEFRFYLLSLINHQTNWRTIERIVKSLFQEHRLEYDFCTVLNLFEAITTNPNLWKGRDKYMSKKLELDSFFKLDFAELELFVNFILHEGLIGGRYDTNIDTDFTLCSRMNLLFKLTEKKRRLIVDVVEYVEHSCLSEFLKQNILQQLYIMYPRIKFLKYIKFNIQSNKLNYLIGCQADKISNNLITCLGSLVVKKDFEILSTDSELLLRKLAASHPLLFLRHLGVMSSIMLGKGQNSMKSLREEHHLFRFVQILRTLELLQPTIFEDPYKNELETCLSCYFTFFKHHSSVKEACQMLVKFVQVLQSYVNYNPSSALLFIEQYLGILTELAVNYSTIEKLNVLMQDLALFQHKSNTCSILYDEEIKFEYELDTHSDLNQSIKIVQDIEFFDGNIQDAYRGTFLGSTLASYCKSSYMEVAPHVLNLIKVIKQSNIEDIILTPLQEMECLTSKRFVFISELFERILELIFSSCAQIRSIAFIILIRHLKHNPGNQDINKCTFNAYIRCLRNENSSVAATAIDNLVEICILLQEYAVEILCVSFSLGIKSSLNTNYQIRKVMQALVVQNGY